MRQQDWDTILQHKEAILKDECFADLWHIDDVREVAIGTSEYPALSTEVSKRVLARMKAMYDPNFGIYWDGVSNDIDHVLAQEKPDE